jgi:predicted metal-binding protein
VATLGQHLWIDQSVPATDHQLLVCHNCRKTGLYQKEEHCNVGMSSSSTGAAGKQKA